MFGFDYAVNRAARDTGVPVVISSRRQLATWKKRRHIRLQQKANTLVDCIVANSQAAVDFAVEQEGVDPGLFRMIHNGLRPDDFVSSAQESTLRKRFDIPPHTKVIGMLANFAPVKDHELFLETARELMGRRPDVFFLLVGTGPLRTRVERIIRKRGWQDRFARIASVEEIPDLLKLMSVSVLCSKSEGFPNAIMESMAAGTPVVAAAVGGIPELIRDKETGILIASRNPKDFADAIDRLLENEEERQTLQRNAAAHAREHLTADVMVDAYRQLYNELLSKSSRAEA